MNRSSSHRETNRMAELDEMVRAAKAAVAGVMAPSEESIGGRIVRQAWLMTVGEMGRGIALGSGVRANDEKGRA